MKLITQAGDEHQTASSALFESLFIVSFVWLIYLQLWSGETVTDTLVSSVIVPNVAQGFGLDMSKINFGFDLVKVQSDAYRTDPRYGLIGIYPVGMPIIAAPIQALLWGTAYLSGVDVSVASPSFPSLRFAFEKASASLLCAVTVLMLYRSLVLLVPWGWAAIMSCLYAFGSSSLSLLGQGLWQHTGINLTCVLLSYFLLIQRNPPTRVRECLFFFAIGFLFSLRATAVVWSFVFFLAFLSFYRRPSALGILAMGLGALPGIIWNLELHNHLLGGYGVASAHYEYVNLELMGYLRRLALILFSSERGFVTFHPILLAACFVPCTPATYRLQGRPVLAILSLGLAFHLLLCATYPGWAGGRCFGPRFMLDGLGVAFIVASVGVVNLSSAKPKVTLTAVAILGAFSIGMHLFGAVGARLPQPSLAAFHQKLLLPSEEIRR